MKEGLNGQNRASSASPNSQRMSQQIWRLKEEVEEKKWNNKEEEKEEEEEEEEKKGTFQIEEQ